MIKALFLIIVLLSPSSALACYKESDTHDANYSRCLKLVETGSYLVRKRAAYILGRLSEEKGTHEQAVEWFEKAIDDNVPEAIPEAYLALGVHYIEGKGVEKNDEKAAELFLMAAMQGQAQAQSNIGRMYWLGRGVPKNDALAYKWLEKASSQGNKSAKQTLYLISLGENPPPELIQEIQDTINEKN